jgi:hypothetical protein
MSDEVVQALRGIVSRLATLVLEDEPLRTGLRQFAQAIIQLDQPAAPASPTTPSEVAEVDPAPALAADDLVPADNGDSEPRPAPPKPERLPPLTLGRVRTGFSGDTTERYVSTPRAGLGGERDANYGSADRYGGAPRIRPAVSRWTPVTNEDLPLIETRCRLKARGARWAAERRRRLNDGADYHEEIEPKDREIIETARAIPDCFLWMNHPSGPMPANLATYEDVAGSFETVAAGVALVRDLLEAQDCPRDAFEQALDLLAEAQSTLRSSVNVIDGGNDSDQTRIYQWLKNTASEQQIFIQRYMRVDDPADAGSWPQVRARIDALHNKFQNTRDQGRKQQARLKRIRYHLKVIQAGTGTPHDWEVIASTVDELVADGLPPSNRELRELLLPVLEDVPELDPVPAGFQLALREADRYLAERPGAEVEAAPAQPSREVQEVASLLRGKCMVLIGGECRPHSQAALESAFDLEELVWVEAREHESLDKFEPSVARPDVAVVVLAIRWSSHSYGDVKIFCERYGKPLVRLPAGYNPNQVAANILSQCSGRLV